MPICDLCRASPKLSVFWIGFNFSLFRDPELRRRTEGTRIETNEMADFPNSIAPLCQLSFFGQLKVKSRYRGG